MFDGLHIHDSRERTMSTGPHDEGRTSVRPTLRFSRGEMAAGRRVVTGSPPPDVANDRTPGKSTSRYGGDRTARSTE